MRLLNYYKSTVLPELVWKQDVDSIYQIPTFNKMVLSSTSKPAIKDKRWYLPEISLLEVVSGQKGKRLAQRKSISLFQIREGQLFGCKFTLRKDVMYLFLDRFVVTILPQLSDFKSISGFGKRDGINIGLNRLFVFNELEQNYQFFEQVTGFNLSLVNVKRNGKESSTLRDNLKVRDLSLRNTIKLTYPLSLFYILKRKRKDLLLLSSFQWPNK